jgi:RHS repeat-associated protein
MPEKIISLSLGNKLYEMSNHLGNVLTVINDIKVPQATNSVDVDGYLATIVSTADYSPFGVQLDERTVSAETYRYGFQGQEKDDELKGAGNSVNYTYRMHDPRLGRFFAVDPLGDLYEYLTPYQFASNSPIYMLELEGLEGVVAIQCPNGNPGVAFNGGSSNQNDIMFVFANAAGGVNTITRALTGRERSLSIITNGRVGAQNSHVQNNDHTVSNQFGVADAWVKNTQIIIPTGGYTGINCSPPTLDPANTTRTTVSGDFASTPPSLAPAPFTGSRQFNIPIAGGATSFTATFDGLNSIPNGFTVMDNLGNTYTPIGGITPTPGTPTNFGRTLAAGATTLTITVFGTANLSIDNFSFSVTTVGPDATAITIPGGRTTPDDSTIINTTAVTVDVNATSTRTQPLNDK